MYAYFFPPEGSERVCVVISRNRHDYRYHQVLYDLRSTRRHFCAVFVCKRCFRRCFVVAVALARPTEFRSLLRTKASIAAHYGARHSHRSSVTRPAPPQPSNETREAVADACTVPQIPRQPRSNRPPRNDNFAFLFVCVTMAFNWIKCRPPVRILFLRSETATFAVSSPMSDNRQMERKLNMPAPKSVQVTSKTDAKKPTGRLILPDCAYCRPIDPFLVGSERCQWRRAVRCLWSADRVSVPTVRLPITFLWLVSLVEGYYF